MIFAKDSQLGVIGKDCFSDSGIREFRAPQSLREIGNGVFSDCQSLERVVLNEGLETIGKLRKEYNYCYDGAFSGTPIK